MELVRSGRADLVCNGRLFLRGHPVEALGPPEHVLVRQGTLAGWPEFSTRLPEEARERLASGASRWELDDGDKMTLQLADIASMWQCGFSAGGPLAALVLCDLRQTHSGGEPSMRRLGEAEAMAGVSENVATEDEWQQRLWHGLLPLCSAVAWDRTVVTDSATFMHGATHLGGWGAGTWRTS
jgi:hypothetical protein